MNSIFTDMQNFVVQPHPLVRPRGSQGIRGPDGLYVCSIIPPACSGSEDLHSKAHRAHHQMPGQPKRPPFNAKELRSPSSC